MDGREIAQLLHRRAEEYLQKVLDKTMEWEDREPYDVKMRELMSILEEVTGKSVNISSKLIYT